MGAVAYDQLGRQTQDAVTAWGSSAADRSIERLTTRYDARGLVVQADSFGSAAPAVNSVSFAHNGWRQLITETQAAGSVSRNVQYGYDGTGAGLVQEAWDAGSAYFKVQLYEYWPAYENAAAFCKLLNECYELNRVPEACRFDCTSLLKITFPDE